MRGAIAALAIAIMGLAGCGGEERDDVEAVGQAGDGAAEERDAPSSLPPTGDVAPGSDPYAAWDEIALSNPADMTESERQLYAFGWLRAEVNNGGFHQFFWNSAGGVAFDAVAASRAAGTIPLAELIEDAMAVFGPEYPTDRVQRQATLDRLSDAELDRLDALDQRYYDLEATTDLDAVMVALSR